MDFFGKKPNKEFDALLNICTSPNFNNEQKIEAIEKLTPFKEAVYYLIIMLDEKDNNPQIRCAVAKALGKMGAVEAVSYLNDALLEEDNVKLRYAAAVALGEFGTDAVSSIHSLITALTDSNNKLNYAAATALDRIDPKWRKDIEDSVRAIPFFVKELLNCDSHARQIASIFLKDLEIQQWPQNADEREKIISLLIIAFVRALIYSDTQIRHRILAILEQYDPEWLQSETARCQIPILMKSQAGSLQEVNNAASQLLDKIDPSAEKIIPAIIEAKIDSQSENRRKIGADALIVLEKLDPNWSHSKPAIHTIPVLIKARVHGNSDICQLANQLLNKISPAWARGEDARSMLSYLIDILLEENNDISLRCAAVKTLEEMGPPVKEGVAPHFRSILLENQGKINALMYAIYSAWEVIDPIGEERKHIWEMMQEVKQDQEAKAPWLLD